MALPKQRLVPRFATALALILLLLPAGSRQADGAEASKPRIVVLMSQKAVPFADILSGFHARMRALGYEPRYTTLFLVGDGAEGMRTFREAKKGGAELVFAIGGPAVESASREALDIPLVAGGMLRADSIRRGSSATGIFLEPSPDVQMRMLRRILPNARSVGVLYNPRENRERIEAAASAAKEQGLRIDAVPVSAPRDIPAALDEVSRRSDVLWCLYDRIATTPDTAQRLLLASFRARVPLVGLSSSWVKAGALYALEWDYADVGAQCADAAAKVLRGARAEEIPPSGPRKSVYVLNLNSARQMNLRLSEDVVRNAHERFRGED